MTNLGPNNGNGERSRPPQVQRDLTANNFRFRELFDFHREVFLTSGALILLFVAVTLIFKEPAENVFGQIQTFIAEGMGWFMILAVSTCLIFVIIMALSKFGQIRIGGQDARPEFPTFAWVAMLISAGMGTGLLFWSVAEPIYHFQSPPAVIGTIEPGTVEAARQSLGVTFFHWGFHAWGMYALVGLGLAFFAYNKGLPLTMRSVFYPILGDRIFGWPGNVIDIVSVAATLFGLATSLGFGVQQVNAGFNFLLPGIPISTPVQVLLIAIITGFATASVVSGLDAGVRRLSELNMILAAILMIFVLFVGPTIFILGSFVETTGYYIASLPTLSFWTETFQGGNWQNSWTVFYWGWWVSWSPFVGIFIARISKGRTVREFVLGVLLLPSLLTFLWMSVFGSTALSLELGGSTIISDAVGENVATALFVMLDQLPLTGITSLVGIILVVVFFVTSSDSGSLVVDSIASGGNLESPVPQRVFWAIIEGAVAAVLLLGGGLQALQTAAITSGLPFAAVLLVLCYSLYKGLGDEYAVLQLRRSSAAEIPELAREEEPETVY